MPESMRVCNILIALEEERLEEKTTLKVTRSTIIKKVLSFMDTSGPGSDLEDKLCKKIVIFLYD
jgi:hypothetical protein